MAYARWAVAAMNSCFVLFWAHYHGIPARPLYDRSPCSGNLYLAFFLACVADALNLLYSGLQSTLS